MPTANYLASCDACGSETLLRADGLALLITDPAGVTVAPHPPVLHPFADYVLEEFGITFTQAAWSGRLIEVTPVVCRSCGHGYEVRKLTAAGVTIGCGGCLAVAGAALVVALLAAVLAGNPVIGAAVGTTLAVAVTFTLEMGASAIVRRRYPERVAAIDGPRTCPNCEGRDTIRASAARGLLPCERCGQREVRVRRAGS